MLLVEIFFIIIHFRLSYFWTHTLNIFSFFLKGYFLLFSFSPQHFFAELYLHTSYAKRALIMTANSKYHTTCLVVFKYFDMHR